MKTMDCNFCDWVLIFLFYYCHSSPKFMTSFLLQSFYKIRILVSCNKLMKLEHFFSFFATDRGNLPFCLWLINEICYFFFLKCLKKFGISFLWNAQFFCAQLMKLAFTLQLLNDIRSFNHKFFLQPSVRIPDFLFLRLIDKTHILLLLLIDEICIFFLINWQKICVYCLLTN